MSLSNVQIRTRIAELRVRLVSERNVTQEEEEELLREIETLRNALRMSSEGVVVTAAAEPTDAVRHRTGAPVHEAMPAGSERRRAKRYEVAVPFQFTILALPDDERLITALREAPKGKKLDDSVRDVAGSADISVSGMRFYASLPIPEGTLIMLEVPASPGSPRRVRMKGEVMWCRKAGENRWEAAVVFRGLDAVTERWLTELRATWSD